jgi:hypothetical protein
MYPPYNYKKIKFFKFKKKKKKSQAPVVHAYNTSYSTGRDQEDQGSKPRFKFKRTYLEKNLHKNRAGGMAEGEGPEFKPMYHKKRKKKLVEEVAQTMYTHVSKCKNNKIKGEKKIKATEYWILKKCTYFTSQNQR